MRIAEIANRVRVFVVVEAILRVLVQHSRTNARVKDQTRTEFGSVLLLPCSGRISVPTLFDATSHLCSFSSSHGFSFAEGIDISVFSVSTPALVPGLALSARSPVHLFAAPAGPAEQYPLRVWEESVAILLLSRRVDPSRVQSADAPDVESVIVGDECGL